MWKSIRRASVVRAGEEVHLRAKAFLVLLFLVEHRDRVVAKEELFERLWPGSTVVDATLVGCIQEIRKALRDQASASRFIKTVPRLGYCFVAPVEEIQRNFELDRVSAVVVMPTRAILTRKPVVALAVLGVVAVGLLAFTLVMRVPPRSANPALSEIAWWKLDQGNGPVISDSSGRGVDGRLVGGTWQPGVLGSALLFNAPGQRAEGVDRRGVLPRGSAPRSLSAWIKRDGPNPDAVAILHVGSPLPTSRDSFRLLLLPDGRPAFACYGTSGFGNDPTLAVASQRLDDGRWHQVVGTFENSRAALFVDGVQQSMVAMAPQIRPESDRQTPWMIGNNLGAPNQNFRGAVDDVRIFGRALWPGEVSALYRCTGAQPDLVVPGRGAFYFLPVFDNQAQYASRVSFGERLKSEATPISNSGVDYAGVQLAARTPDCAVASLRGADIGQDMFLSVELFVPRNAGFDTQAGPYFRSRLAYAGDGLIGGTSAGYWVVLHSTGAVTVKLLNPPRTVAFTKSFSGFDSTRFHRLEAVVKGETLDLALDGRKLIFDQNGQLVRTVRIPSEWDGPPRAGHNEGAAGIAFASEPLRFQAGGQQARNFSIQ
jgi:DNA-binding winged helix-turn-helix (wHTH) protein